MGIYIYITPLSEPSSDNGLGPSLGPGYDAPAVVRIGTFSFGGLVVGQFITDQDEQ